MAIDLNGQVGLVVGASGGIGTAVSRQLAAAGAALGLFARGADRLGALASELGGAALVHAGDATVAADLAGAVQALIDRHGRVDFLVHAVGSIKLAPLHLAKEADFEATWRLNTLSPMLAMKAVLPGMLSRKQGAIVCCSSVAGHVGLPYHEVIAAAQGGLEAMIKAAAMTYAPSNVRVNAVAPGLVKTPLSAPLTSRESALETSLAMHPLGRLGEPEDVADAIVYLLTADWVTGAVLDVNGGMGAGMHRHG